MRDKLLFIFLFAKSMRIFADARVVLFSFEKILVSRKMAMLTALPALVFPFSVFPAFISWKQLKSRSGSTFKCGYVFL